MRRGKVLGVERRRRWSDEEKLAILARAGVAGRTVADVAREEDLIRQHIYQWRQKLRRKGVWRRSEEMVFLPVDLPPALHLASEMGARLGKCAQLLRKMPPIGDASLTPLNPWPSVHAGNEGRHAASAQRGGGFWPWRRRSAPPQARKHRRFERNG